MDMKQPVPLILASTSPYRRELLAKLGIPFQTQAPSYDEDLAKKQAVGLQPKDLAMTLARGKALSLSQEDNCVIGGDQLLSLDGEIFGKPRTVEAAEKQLQKLNGKTHELITAVCVVYKKQEHLLLDITKLKMRNLSPQQIKNYIQMDQPLDCCGSYKIEKQGLSLFESIECKDFSAIQGLPLLQLGSILQKQAYTLLQIGTKNESTP